MVTCYPVMGKKKSLDICHAFADGCGGSIGYGKIRTADNAAFFYGVDASNEVSWKYVKDEGIPYYYCDNSYFDPSRQDYFRVTRNALQHSGEGKSDGHRFVRLERDYGVGLRPWFGNYNRQTIVLCPQSPHFMHVIAERAGDWLEDTKVVLRKYTGRPFKVRDWSSNKTKLSSTLAADLQDAYVLVTWSSAAAITAILSGVPAVCLGPCAAQPMATPVEELDFLRAPDRENWAAVLADNQWTLEEFRNGTAWRALR